MPELAEAPTPETINPSLKALFDIKVAEPEETDDFPEKTEDPPHPAKPTEKETPVAAPIEEKKPDALTSRLAPDFAAEVEEKPAAEVSTDIEITEEMIAEEKNPKKQANLRELGKALEQYKKENRDLKSRPAVAPEETESKTLLETVTRERDDLLARVERANLLESPKFQRDYLEPRAKEFSNAQGIVKDAGADPAMLTRAISLTGKGRIEALDEIREAIPSDMMKGRFDRLIESIDNRTVEINERLANAKTAAQEQAKQETIQRHETSEKMTKELKSLLGAARSDLLENVKLETLQKVGKPGFEWWDEQVDEIDQVAEEILLKSTPQKAAVAAYLAASAGALRSMFQAERESNKAKDREIAELKGATPRLEADRSRPKPEKDGIEPDDITARLREGFYKRK